MTHNVPPDDTDSQIMSRENNSRRSQEEAAKEVWEGRRKRGREKISKERQVEGGN